MIRELLVAVVAAGVVIFARSAQAEYVADLQTLARHTSERNPELVIGIEVIADLNSEVKGEASIVTAMSGLKPFAEVIAEKTDYEVEVENNNILIRPKLDAAKYATPLSERKVKLVTDGKSLSIRDAIASLESGEKFTLVVASGNELGIGNPRYFDSSRVVVPIDVTSSSLADVLFKMTRSAGAKSWFISHSIFTRNNLPPKRPLNLSYATIEFLN